MLPRKNLIKYLSRPSLGVVRENKYSGIPWSEEEEEEEARLILLTRGSTYGMPGRRPKPKRCLVALLVVKEEEEEEEEKGTTFPSPL